MSPQPESASAGLSEISRLSGVFFEPKKTFADIGQRPRWIVPLVLLILASVGFSFCLGQRVGWDRIMRQGFESSARVQSMTADQRAAAEKMIDKQAAFAPIMGYVGAVVGLPLYYLIIAGVTMLLVNVMGAQLRFKQVWAVVVYSMLPSLVSMAAAVLVMFLKNPEEYNVRNPVGFNPGAYMDPNTTSKFVHSLATSLDLFVIWIILLMAAGFAAAARKFSFGKALLAVLLPWAVFVLGKAALAPLIG